MIFVLLAALAVGVACYFGIDALGTAAIDRWYLSDDAIAARNLEHARSLQEYVSARGVSSRDTLAIEQWSRGEKKGRRHRLSGGGRPVRGRLVLGFVIYSFIAFGFTRRLTRRVTRLSEAVGAAGALNRTIPVTGTDEIARLAASVNTMRDTILERTRDEQTAWQANSDLITAMSHDIRNPLTSLIGYLDLLEMSQDRLPEDLRSYVLASRDKSYQLKDLTGEMFRYFLVFSRGEQETHPEPYDAQILCAQLLGECAAELRSRGFDVNLLLLTTPCTVTTDVQMLKRVTDNLLSNIEKYADPAARLTILAECEGERLHVCFANRARRELARVESNHIGLRTCEAILQLLGGQFFTHRTGDDFSAEFVLPRTPPDAAQG